MITKKALGVLLVMVLSASLLACGPTPPVSSPSIQTTPTPSPSGQLPPAPSPAAFKWPSSVTIGTQGVGSSAYVDFGGLATVMEQSTGMSVRIVPEDNTVLRMNMLQTRRIDLFLESSTVTSSMEGLRLESMLEDRGPFQMRIISQAYGNRAFGFFVQKDSPIKTVYDIGPETRVAIYPGPSALVFAMLAGLGLNDGPVPIDPMKGKWKVKVVTFGSWDASMRSVAEGKADVAMCTAAATAVIEAAASPKGIRFLELPIKTDPEFVKRFLAVRPTEIFGPAPHDGVKEIWDVITIGGGGHLFARSDTPDDFAYNFIKWMTENFDKYKDKSARLRSYTIQDFRLLLNYSITPVHPGTIKYLKEVGMWKPADDLRNEYNQKLMDWYIELFPKGVAAAKAQGIAVTGTSEPWFNFWQNYKKSSGIPPYKTMTDNDITDGLAYLKSKGR
ncbi:MAG: TAXI family TRAP transporter solute-binding subunit [Chloroflexota bacterium]